MRKPILLAALLAGLAGLASPARADQCRDRRPDDQAAVQVAVPAHWHPGDQRWRLTPWHHHAFGRCPSPDCLPSWHRHRERADFRRILPLDRVLERLEQHDYRSFGAVFLDGPHYSIEARSRYGRTVRLIVDAGTGQIQRILQ